MTMLCPFRWERRYFIVKILKISASIIFKFDKFYEHNSQLYEAALKYHGNDTQQVQMVRINASYGLGHKYICRYKELPEIIE